mmetsp:Transcript_3096/g.12582  ORF Transcript_3096/g.12582 Transcript_3096/m.12582 type:complete len:340 (-) Transcript_3096:1011-2030(-)
MTAPSLTGTLPTHACTPLRSSISLPRRSNAAAASRAADPASASLTRALGSGMPRSAKLAILAAMNAPAAVKRSCALRALDLEPSLLELVRTLGATALPTNSIACRGGRPPHTALRSAAHSSSRRCGNMSHHTPPANNDSLSRAVDSSAMAESFTPSAAPWHAAGWGASCNSSQQASCLLRSTSAASLTRMSPSSRARMAASTSSCWGDACAPVSAQAWEPPSDPPLSCPPAPSASSSRTSASNSLCFFTLLAGSKPTRSRMAVLGVSLRTMAARHCSAASAERPSPHLSASNSAERSWFLPSAPPPCCGGSAAPPVGGATPAAPSPPAPLSADSSTGWH